MSSNRQTSGSAYDPWDAPYFGAPIYLGYPAFRGALGAVNGSVTFRDQATPNPTASAQPRSDPTPTAQQIEPDPTEPTPPSAPAPRRRGWFARLFGAR
jgi:hypothetical protein